ncbi:MAG TPA: phosphoglycerate mutase family protein [Thermohalobaculum sp.]|nr:phosphoglycerate mutase family protein [Thermohalobaculum sp.]
MFLICITHGDARTVEPREAFRALTEQGRADVEKAGARFLSILPGLAPELDDGRITIDWIVSSPHARCIETVVLFADVIRRLTRTSEISVNSLLNEKKGGRLQGADLQTVAQERRGECFLLSTHGDLAGALPPSARLASPHDQGWFKGRPAYALIDYDRDTVWDDARVMKCEVLGWQDVLIP